MCYLHVRRVSRFHPTAQPHGRPVSLPGLKSFKWLPGSAITPTCHHANPTRWHLGCMWLLSVLTSGSLQPQDHGTCCCTACEYFTVLTPVVPPVSTDPPDGAAHLPVMTAHHVLLSLSPHHGLPNGLSVHVQRVGALSLPAVFHWLPHSRNRVSVALPHRGLRSVCTAPARDNASHRGRKDRGFRPEFFHYLGLAEHH